MSRDMMKPYPDITGLPRTGQVTTTPTAEYQEGDDGWYQAGHPSTNRFIDMGNGVVRDTLYTPELMWPKTPHLMIPGPAGVAAENTIQAAAGMWTDAGNYVSGNVVQGDGAPDLLFYVCILANGPGGVGAQEPPNATYWVVTPWIGSATDLTTAEEMNWSDGITNCEALDYAGFTDWRMPNMNELGMLYNAEDSTTPSMFPPFVITSGASGIWTSTTRKASTTNAQRILFGTQFTASVVSKGSTLAVMPVRGGKINA